MAVNPSKQGPILNPATQRGSRINDPQFHLNQGYSPFDLSHHEMFTSRFGEYTPSMHLDTIPADRHVVMQSYKTLHNRIDGNLLSTVNQYDETFFVSLCNLIPYAYERFIPNPVKGDDLPNSALPQIPIAHFLALFIASDQLVDIYDKYGSLLETYAHYELMRSPLELTPDNDELVSYRIAYAIGYMLMLSSIVSRGQLLDMFGFQLEIPHGKEEKLDNSVYNSDFQDIIDRFYNSLVALMRDNLVGYHSLPVHYKYKPETEGIFLTDNVVVFSTEGHSIKSDASTIRSFISDCLEHGELPFFEFQINNEQTWTDFVLSYGMIHHLFSQIVELFITEDSESMSVDYPTIDQVNSSSDPFRLGFINALKPLAYQLCIAQYGTNDLVDNVYTSELYMQNLRSTMFPSADDLSEEPIYNYNGVQFEYDLMTYGAWRRSFFTNTYAGNMARVYVVSSLLFIMRRSLRYGDMFATARPNMLAVGDLYINVEDGKVSPIDVTKNLLLTRYLNSANYLGQRIDSLYSAVYGVVPSDRPSCPRYISHRKTILHSQITNNTADEQGKQTTNLVGEVSGDSNAIDIFIDDYGIILSIVSYDVLPLYSSGIDRSFHFSDRFDYYNPQLQNIGDQPVLKSELYGDFYFTNFVFGYQMRNAELKYKVSRSHGGLVNDLPGFVFRYPPEFYSSVKIGPNFIRDKPMFFDQLATQLTGNSPAQYYHFVVSCQNEVKSARLMQATPPILF